MTEDRYGRRTGGPRNKVYSTSPTADKVPEDRCRQCQQWVRFVPNGDGYIVAVHPTTLESHPCPNP